MAPSGRSQRGITAVRITVSILLILHGVARIGLHIVDDFGLFLSSVGLPFGEVLAWGITLFEISAGGALAIGRWIRPISALLCIELAAGIGLVHWSEGWFVVGAGRNGMEYSVLLITCLLAVAYVGGSRGDQHPE